MLSRSRIGVLVTIWCVCLTGLGVAYGVFVYPRQVRFRALQNDVSQKAARFEYLQQAKSVTYQNRLKESLRELEKRCGDLLFSAEGLNSLDFRLNELATQNGLSEFSSRNLFSKEDRYFSRLESIGQRQVVVQFTAPFTAFLRFLNALERNRPALFINQFRLSGDFSPDKSSASGQIEFAGLYEEAPEGPASSPDREVASELK